MDIWTIRGGNRLDGECRVQGSKNASLPILAASILRSVESELTNVPRLRDIDAALRILRHLGCQAEQKGNTLYIDARGLVQSAVPHELMAEMRSSVIFMGALLARCGEARLSPPGGCQLGRRPIDLHLSALRQLGAAIEEKDGEILCRAESLRGTTVRLPFPSVGATENVMLAATAAKGAPPGSRRLRLCRTISGRWASRSTGPGPAVSASPAGGTSHTQSAVSSRTASLLPPMPAPVRRRAETWNFWT